MLNALEFEWSNVSFKLMYKEFSYVSLCLKINHLCLNKQGKKKKICFTKMILLLFVSLPINKLQ